MTKILQGFRCTVLIEPNSRVMLEFLLEIDLAFLITKYIFSYIQECKLPDGRRVICNFIPRYTPSEIGHDMNTKYSES